MKLAYFDPANGKVLQWIDTDEMAYVLPDESMLYECSATEWEARHDGEMIVKDGALRPYIGDEMTSTRAQIIARYEAALDVYLDSVAQMHRYRDRVTFALRSGYAGPWQEEGTAFAIWMDACNLQAFQLLENVLAGNAELPTIEDFIGGLPTFVLP